MEININKSNVLVTGGTGFVGSHLVKQLVKLENNVVTTFRTINPHSYFFTQHLDKKVSMVNADICDFEKIFDIITRFKIDYIFHLAAQPLVEVAYSNPKQTICANVIGTVNLLESTRLFSNIKAIIVSSSDKAYGKLNKGKYEEKDPLRGDHPYEVSKSSSDLISYSYFKTYNIPVVISRFGNIYGEGDINFSRIIPGIMKALIKDEVFEIRSNGQYKRDYLYVKDVVEGYILLALNIDKIRGESFNFGSDDNYSVIDLIKLVEENLNKKIKYKLLNNARNEILYQSLNYDKIKTILGWKPCQNLNNTLPKIFKWYKTILKI